MYNSQHNRFHTALLLILVSIFSTPSVHSFTLPHNTASNGITIHHSQDRIHFSSTFQSKNGGYKSQSFIERKTSHIANKAGTGRKYNGSSRLTTSLDDGGGMKQRKRDKYFIQPLRKAGHKFKSRPGTYMLIPCVAALVGWLTNWLAVQMIFYPISFRGIPLYRIEEAPLGLIGWQGIVPCKTRTMSEAMVEMVTSQLLSVKLVFQRLDPRKVADLLAPEVPKLGQSIVDDLVPLSWASSLPASVFVGLPQRTKELISHMNHNFLKDFTISMQQNIDSLLNVRNCVVEQMLNDRTKLGELFRKCGQKELDFLTNSGLWFGFLLGLIQMGVALFWENPWSLSIGGGIVGLATNWLALKWIFEPVNPTKFGPFILQGQFLRRQKEVAAEFSSFFANKILTSEKMWNSILTDPSTTPAFNELFTAHLTKFAKAVSSGLGMMPEPEVLKMAAGRAIEKLPNHIGVLHSYVDDKLKLQETLRVSMENMSSAQFERVLHPIFEEDELTLILAGAALGFAAGLVQQGLETGKIQIPGPKEVWKRMFDMIHKIRLLKPSRVIRHCITGTCSRINSGLKRFINRKGRKGSSSSEDDHLEPPEIS